MFAFSNGPPEFPGFIGVWVRPRPLVRAFFRAAEQRRRPHKAGRARGRSLIEINVPMLKALDDRAANGADQSLGVEAIHAALRQQRPQRSASILHQSKARLADPS
jgi:hypothetical protein